MSSIASYWLAAEYLRRGAGLNVLSTAEAYWLYSQYLGSGDWVDESGNGHDAVFTGPKFLPYAGTRYCYFPGVAGNFLSLADFVLPSGEWELEWTMFADDWTPTADQDIVRKWGASGNFEVLIKLDTTGGLDCLFSPDGTNLNTFVSDAIGAAAGESVKLKITAENDGGGGTNYKVYKNDVQHGSTINKVRPPGIFNGTNQCNIGGHVVILAGGLYSLVWKDGIGGSDIVNININAIGVVEPYTSFVDGTGKTVTNNKAATGPKTSFCDRALMLCGTDDYFEVADHADLDFAADEDFSIAGMVRVYDETPAAAMVLAGKKDDLTTAAGYMPYLDTDAKIKMVIDDTVTDPVTVETAAISAGYATMWGFSRDADGNLQGYINGIASGSAVADTTTDTLANARPFRMGASSHATPASHLDGEIISCALFTSTLSPAAWWALNEEFRATTLPLLRRARYRQMMRGQ